MDKQPLTRPGAALQEQRAEAAKLLAGLRDTYQQARRRHDDEVEALKRRVADSERERDEALQRCQTAEARVEQLEGSQHEIVAQAEAALHEQQEELTRVLTELSELGGAAFPASSPAADEALRAENVALLERLQLREQELARICQEAAKISVRLQQCEDALCVAFNRAETAEEQSHRVETLEQLVADLRRQLQERDTQVSQLRIQECRPTLADDDDDIASYEAELVQYHRQLEADRAALNEEIKQLRARNQELSAAARQVWEQMEHEAEEFQPKPPLEDVVASCAPSQPRPRNNGHLVLQLSSTEVDL